MWSQRIIHVFLTCWSILYWKVLASHIDKSAWLEVQVRQLLQMANQQQSKFDLKPLVEAIDTVKQKITLLETNDQRLGMSNVFCFSSGASWLLHVFTETRKWASGEAQPSRVNSAESGICEAEQYEVLGTQTKMMKGPEWELEQGQGGNRPGNSKNREWWFVKESRQWKG